MSRIKLLGFKGTYGNAKVDREFEGLLDAINPDIVHFHHLLDLSASLIKLVKRITIETLGKSNIF